MILVDTSVWVDHLRAGDSRLAALLEKGGVVGHPFVTGEIALGPLARRATVLEALSALPQAIVASHVETMAFVERWRLFGRGIGFVDVHLLASARLTAGVALWTRDKRLQAVAADLGLAADGV